MAAAPDSAAVQPAVAAAPSSATIRDLPPTARGVLIRRLRGRILEAAVRHGASNVRLFGSTARGDDGPDSDIDLLVYLQPSVGLFGLFRLQEELERLLDAPVDVIPDDGLKPRVRPAVERDLIPLRAVAARTGCVTCSRFVTPSSSTGAAARRRIR